MSIAINLPHSVGYSKKEIPHSEREVCHIEAMGNQNTNQVLWHNVRRLMEHAYGKENLTRLANESGCGPGTMSRIKAMQTSIGLDVLEKISEVFHLQPWQLLTPNIDPKNPPVIWLTRAERDLYSRLKVIVSEVGELPP